MHWWNISRKIMSRWTGQNNHWSFNVSTSNLCPIRALLLLCCSDCIFNYLVEINIVRNDSGSCLGPVWRGVASVSHQLNSNQSVVVLAKHLIDFYLISGIWYLGNKIESIFMRCTNETSAAECHGREKTNITLRTTVTSSTLHSKCFSFLLLVSSPFSFCRLLCSFNPHTCVVRCHWWTPGDLSDPFHCESVR